MHYSYTTGGFYHAEYRSDYEAAGTWPADAIELTADEHATLRSGLDAGKLIASGPDGRPILVDPPLPPIADIKAAALAAIDSSAGAARSRYITVATGQESTYQAKSAEAASYIAAGRPADAAPYPILSAEATVRGISVSAMTDMVIATRDQWTAIAAQIEAQRIKGKLAVEAAAAMNDRAGLAAARDAAIAALGAL